jgi:hypothetical protein
MITWFKAFDRHGKEVLVVKTTTPATTEAEKQAFQSRLDKGELSYVEVWTDKPFSETERMYRR